MGIIEFSLKRSLLMNLLMVLVIFIGAFKVYQMRREAFPSIDFDFLTISTSYPGASPKESELYVTTPIERELKAVSGLKEKTSISIKNLSLIVLKLDPDLDEGKKRKTIDEVQRAVDRVSDLPEDLPDPPIVKEATSGDFPIMDIAIYGDLPYDKIHEIADKLADKIENIAHVSAVRKRGFREKEFWIEVSPNKLKRYNLPLTAIIAALKARNINLPGGAIEAEKGEILVRTIGEVKNIEEIKNIVLRSNASGIIIRIKDVAEVRSTFEDRKEILNTNGANSINLQVIKSSTGDIITLVDKAKKITENHLSSLNGKKAKAAYVNDMSFFVRNRLGVLLNNGIVGIVLVLFSLLLFLTPGIGVVTAFGMPVAFLGAVAWMGFSGMTINLLTMFGMVIVLGMLVDDAIIVAENIWQHYEGGESPYDAAIKGTSEVFWPVTATILTTIAAFSPLLMISGILGKFIRHLPMVVIIALGMSLLEAMLILPTHAYEALRYRERRLKKKNISSEKAEEGKSRNRIFHYLVEHYATALQWVLKQRYVFIFSIVAVFLGSVGFAYIKMPWILFPSEGIEAFFIRADLPVRNSLVKTSEKFTILEKMVKQLPENELLDYVSQIGRQQRDAGDPFTQIGTHLGQIQVFLTPEKKRQRSASEIIDDLRPKIEKLAKKNGFTQVQFEKVRQGPPVGAPVAIRIRGENLEEIDKISDVIQEKLKTFEYVSDVNKNFRQGKDELKILIDDKRAASSLLTVDDIARHVRTAFAGSIASYVRNGKERIGIRVRYRKSDRRMLKTLDNILIPNKQGNLIRLDKVAHLERGPGVNAIFHRDNIRSIKITTAIDEANTTSEKVNKALAPYLKKIGEKHPNVTLEAGGEWEETNESMASLREAAAIAMGLIFLILATQFGSLTQPLVVMASIPFGIIGIIWAFFLHDIPLSFLGMIGAIGLTGVVVNDSIVLVDFINKAREKGMGVAEAIIYAGKRRFRAVWLTTLTTVFGLLPLVYGIGGVDKFLQPAAIALAYGLIFGTVLVLFFVPSLYLIRSDIGSLFIRKRT